MTRRISDEPLAAWSLCYEVESLHPHRQNRDHQVQIPQHLVLFRWIWLGRLQDH